MRYRAHEEHPGSLGQSSRKARQLKRVCQGRADDSAKACEAPELSSVGPSVTSMRTKRIRCRSDAFVARLVVPLGMSNAR